MSDTMSVNGRSLETFVDEVLRALGASAEHAATVARVLVDADIHGVDTHGVARLSAYVRLLDRGLIDLDAEPEIGHDGGAVATVDGANAFGQVAGELSIDLACRLADECGIGFVTTFNSNHFGTVGYYTRRAAARGFVAFAGTNSAAVVAPTRAKRRFIGTNPLAFAVPGRTGVAIDLDMSTSSVAGGKLEQAMRAGREIPEGWLLDAEGEPVTDPSKGLAGGGALLPLGGSELHGSYKGFGLALMVEVLSSGLVGAPYGSGVGPLTSGEPSFPARVSHFFMALDPARFESASVFAGEIDALCDDIRRQTPLDPELPVMVPGDPEVATAARRRRTGVPLHPSVFAALDELADRVGVLRLGRTVAAADDMAGVRHG